ncbi:Clp protease N-terminal domain-containing protein [Streptomyces sp. NPDC049954]|uniref:Clp protease N-terminal domain-containing protein n=1 Tax=Streptomyces sp. NPDC049954 TaxID=3155779 RepID=UPI003414CA00
MQRPIQQPYSEPGPARGEPRGALGDELATVVSGARRRAARDGDPQIDTAHLLHSLLESDPRARSFVDPAHLGRLLGYLVQRSIGYGLQWQGTVEDSGGIPVLREAGWSPAASLAMERAVERATERAGERATGCGADAPPGGTDLLAALAADPECRAAGILRRAGVDPGALCAALVAADREPQDDGCEESHQRAGRPAYEETAGPGLVRPRPPSEDPHEFARGIDVSRLRQQHRE